MVLYHTCILYMYTINVHTCGEALFCESQVSIVLTEGEAVLGARGEHALYMRVYMYMYEYRCV